MRKRTNLRNAGGSSALDLCCTQPKKSRLLESPTQPCCNKCMNFSPLVRRCRDVHYYLPSATRSFCLSSLNLCRIFKLTGPRDSGSLLRNAVWKPEFQGCKFGGYNLQKKNRDAVVYILPLPDSIQSGQVFSSLMNILLFQKDQAES